MVYFFIKEIQLSDTNRVMKAEQLKSGIVFRQFNLFAK